MQRTIDDVLLEGIIQNPDSFLDESTKDDLTELVRRATRFNLRSGFRHVAERLQRTLDLQACGFHVNSDLNISVEYDPKRRKVVYFNKTPTEEVETPTIFERRSDARLVCPLYYRGKPAFGYAFFEKKTFTEKDVATIISCIKRFSSGLNVAMEGNHWQRMAIYDVLTGAYRRDTVALYYQQLITDRQRKGSPLSVIIIDVDKFKELNDTYGHVYGDHVLKVVAKKTSSVVRPEDILVRWGGDEFVVLLPNTPNEKAKDIARRIEEAIETTDFMEELESDKDPAKEEYKNSIRRIASKKYYLGKTARSVRVSVGVDWKDRADGKGHVSSILQAICDGADKRMYQEKKTKYVQSAFTPLSRSDKLFNALVLMWNRRRDNMGVFAYNALNLEEAITKLGETAAWGLFTEVSNQLEQELEGADLVAREDDTDKIFAVYSSPEELDQFRASMEALGRRTLDRLHSYQSTIAPDYQLRFSLGIALFNKSLIKKRVRGQLLQQPQEVRNIARRLTKEAIGCEGNLVIQAYSH